MKVKLDLNNSDFQKEWFALEKNDFVSTKNTLQTLSEMGWNQVHSDKGLKWEKI